MYCVLQCCPAQKTDELNVPCMCIYLGHCLTWQPCDSYAWRHFHRLKESCFLFPSMHWAKNSQLVVHLGNAGNKGLGQTFLSLKWPERSKENRSVMNSIRLLYMVILSYCDGPCTGSQGTINSYQYFFFLQNKILKQTSLGNGSMTSVMPAYEMWCIL